MSPETDPPKADPTEADPPEVDPTEADPTEADPTEADPTEAVGEAPCVAERPEGYRPGVGVLLFNDAGRVFVAQRIDTAAPAWQMPQGGIDPGEDPRAAALRELEEEIGTRNAEIVAATPGWLLYDLPAELRGKMWRGRFRGQAQKWYAARFLGIDDEIDLEADDHAEFSAWRWADPETLPDLIVDFKRPLYRAILRELQPAIEATVAR